VSHVRNLEYIYVAASPEVDLTQLRSIDGVQL
jgi:hypothetical protein